MGELRPEAQGLVQAGRDALRPTPADRERIRAALGARLGGGGPPAAAPTPPAGGLGWPAISALAVVLALGGGLAVRAFGAKPAPSPTRVASAPASPLVAPSPASPPAATAIVPADLPPAVVEAAPQPSHRATDRLAEEVAMLAHAETELHAGRFTSALRVLDEHQRKFPHGTLTQERVAARVHALCGLGRVADANAEMARLSPGSLHEGRAREACATSPKK